MFPADWDVALSQLEFEYDGSKQKTSRLAPFEVKLGRISQNQFTRRFSDSLLRKTPQCRT